MKAHIMFDHGGLLPKIHVVMKPDSMFEVGAFSFGYRTGEFENKAHDQPDTFL